MNKDDQPEPITGVKTRVTILAVEIQSRRIAPQTVSIGALVLNRVPTDMLTGVAPGTPIIIGRGALFPIQDHLRSRLKADRLERNVAVLRGGFVSRLFSRSESARISFGRVCAGSITSSTNPRSAAT
jgi:hypothetical protein